ncbi:hypothetical protein P879_06924 [Paragonimus westermani]|uniref:Protein kinase domain-containing protein n=1 Tax=Paragonimus westermani TaxID=34504 RepID=A0A8T0D1D0_9TREM|nr:hypothetical protein P879_06924 [Paragonimus westermani]
MAFVSMCFGYACSVLLLVTYAASHEAEFNLNMRRCLRTEETPSWNRTFHFDNHGLNLTLEVTGKPSHWILNYIFGILAHEKLGYQNITFVEHTWDEPTSSFHRLECGDSRCTQLPQVHVNLEVWLPLGSSASFWSPSSKVTDHGPLGPVSRWTLLTSSDFIHRLRSANVSRLESLCCSHAQRFFQDRHDYSRATFTTPSFCDLPSGCNASCHRDHLLSFLTQSGAHSVETTSNIDPVNAMLINWYPNGIGCMSSTLAAVPFTACDSVIVNANWSGSCVPHRWLPPQTASPQENCVYESHQAVKLTWAKLKTSLPLVYQLVDQMRLSQADFDELVDAAYSSSAFASEAERRSHYYNVSCNWVRRYPNRWKAWTKGWKEKQNLTIAGLFTLYGKWVIPNLHTVAMQAIQHVNQAPNYFANTEYALTLDVRNLTCVQDIVVKDYFDLLMSTSESKLVGVIAALCSDSIEPVIEVANYQRQLVVSPTVESARIVKKRDSPYFFRTVPSMLTANLALVRLFLNWSWHRIAVFRKDDHFLDPRLYQVNGIEVIIDAEMKDHQLTYEFVQRHLKEMVHSNSRIFIIEHFAQGTALVLCAAYHLGLHFDAGYVWFINPWLSEGWWKPNDVRPSECSYEEMANITSWTFTITHQLGMAPVWHSYMHMYEHSLTRERDVRLHSRSSDSFDLFPEALPYTGTDYTIYTYESVIVLALALVNLLRAYPSAISIFDSPEIAEAYRHLVSNTDIVYTDFLKPQLLNMEPFFSGEFVEFLSSAQLYGSHRTRDSHPSRLRFNELNERVADFWLLKQHQVNKTSPIVMLYFNEDLPNAPFRLSGDGSIPSVNDFNQLVRDRWFDSVYWGKSGKIPGDGSETGENCTFSWLSDLFRVNCSTATVIFSIIMVLLVAMPIFVLFIVYYRRKLKEAERRIRQPYEELCAELQDIDIPCSDVVFSRPVGQGAFGMVFGGEAKHKGTWEAVAVKVIGGKATYEGKRDFLAEAKLMRELDHKNVVRLIGICLKPRENHLYLIMEVMLNSDMKTYLLSRRPLAQQDPDHVDVRPSTLTQMTIDIAEGLAYLHSKDLVHRDIACRNCLVSSDRVVKIGDFGLARKLNNTGNEGYYRFTRNCQLPVRWMSPEAVQLGVFSPQSDIWSYGIVLYEIITFGVLPYGRLGEVEVVERVKQINFSILDFLPPAAVNTTVAGLINQCCQHQWQHRPEKMEVIIQQLREYPDCVRPFLTDEPPKPNRAIDALPFQPGAGACMMSENALTPDGPNPSANNPTSNAVAITDTVSNNHSSAVYGVGHARGFHSTTGSLTGTGRSPLVYYSADSFTDAATTLAARRPLASESTVYPSGRRRHKTADGAVSSTKNAYLCRGTSSSSGHTGQDSEVSFEDPKGPASDITQEFLHGWCAVGDATPIGGDCVSNSHRNIPNVSRRYRSEHGKRIHDQLSARRHWMCKPGHEVTELTPMLLTRLTCNTGPLSLDKSAGSTPLDLHESVTDGSAAPEPDGHQATQNRLALDKQLNGILSTTIRSLSTGYISSCPSCTDANVALAKSAPDGNPSLYVGISRGKQNVSDVLFHPELSDHHASQHAHTRFGATRTGRHCLTTHGLSAGAPNQSSTLTTRSVVDNASCLLRSVLRMFTRGNKTRALSYPDTGLRCTKSSISCRALGVTPITDLPTGPLHNQAESGHMSTSCPPLFMAQLSTVGQHLPNMNPHSDPMMLNRDMCIPPVPQRFFPITETVVNQPVATPSDITDSSVRDLPGSELSRSPHELVPLLATNPSIHSLQSKSGATLFSLSSSSPSPTPAPPSSTPPASSTNGLLSNGDHHQSFYLV